MNILIVSDSHGRTSFLEHAILRNAPLDYLIHLGDIEGDEEYIREIAQCPVYIVAGNNDFFSREPREQMIQIGQYKIFMAHGHRHGVYNGIEMIKRVARECGANIAMYGHTHVPLLDMSDDVWVMNPGSISLPRQTGRQPSYITMQIGQAGEVHVEIEYFER